MPYPLQPNIVARASSHEIHALGRCPLRAVNISRVQRTPPGHPSSASHRSRNANTNA